MHKKKVPYRILEYGLVWVFDTRNLVSTSSKYSDGRTPLEMVTWDTPYIREWPDFRFYDWVNYRDNAGLG